MLKQANVQCELPNGYHDHGTTFPMDTPLTGPDEASLKVQTSFRGREAKTGLNSSSIRSSAIDGGNGIQRGKIVN